MGAYVRGLLGEVERKNGWTLAETAGDSGPEGMQRVFLAYASDRGRALIDRELYLPKAWTEDRERCRSAGIGDEVEFATKPELAQAMIEQALDAGVPFGWLTGDEAYGQVGKLRLWLESRGVAHVLAVPKSQMVISMELRQRRAHTVIADLPATAWQRINCGDGAHGPRLSDWAVVDIRPLRERGRGHWLLARRSIADPDEIAYYICFGPADTELAELVRVAGSRWAIEECFQTTKNEVGLDHYQVRGYPAWYRHITLSMAAAAFLTILRRGAEKGDLRPVPKI